MSGIRQRYPLQWCDMGLIASGHKGGACAIVVLVSVDRPLVHREIVGSRAVLLRKTRCGSDQKGSMCTVIRESVPRWSLRIQPTRSSDVFRRESESQCTRSVYSCLFIAMTHGHEPRFKVLSHHQHPDNRTRQPSAKNPPEPIGSMHRTALLNWAVAKVGRVRGAHLKQKTQPQHYQHEVSPVKPEPRRMTSPCS